MTTSELIAALAIFMSTITAIVQFSRQSRSEDKTESKADREKLWLAHKDLEKNFTNFKTFAAGHYVKNEDLEKIIRTLKEELDKDFRRQDEGLDRRFSDLKQYIASSAGK